MTNRRYRFRRPGRSPQPTPSTRAKPPLAIQGYLGWCHEAGEWRIWGVNNLGTWVPASNMLPRTFGESLEDPRIEWSAFQQPCLILHAAGGRHSRQTENGILAKLAKEHRYHPKDGALITWQIAPIIGEMARVDDHWELRLMDAPRHPVPIGTLVRDTGVLERALYRTAPCMVFMNGDTARIQGTAVTAEAAHRMVGFLNRSLYARHAASDRPIDWRVVDPLGGS